MMGRTQTEATQVKGKNRPAPKKSSLFQRASAKGAWNATARSFAESGLCLSLEVKKTRGNLSAKSVTKTRRVRLIRGVASSSKSGQCAAGANHRRFRTKYAPSLTARTMNEVKKRSSLSLWRTNDFNHKFKEEK